MAVAVAGALFLHRLLHRPEPRASAHAGWAGRSRARCWCAATRRPRWATWTRTSSSTPTRPTSASACTTPAGRCCTCPAREAVHHDQLITDLRSARRRIVEFHRNRDRYMRKHHGTPERYAVRALGVWFYLVRAVAALAVPGHDPRRYLLQARQELMPGRGRGNPRGGRGVQPPGANRTVGSTPFGAPRPRPIRRSRGRRRGGAAACRARASAGARRARPARRRRGPARAVDLGHRQARHARRPPPGGAAVAGGRGRARRRRGGWRCAGPRGSRSRCSLAAPLRPPITFESGGGFPIALAEDGQLGRLLPLYFVLAAAALALVWRVLRGDSGAARAPSAGGGAARRPPSSPSPACRSSGPTGSPGAPSCSRTSPCRSPCWWAWSRGRRSPTGRRARWPGSAWACGVVFAAVGLYQAATRELFFFAPNLAVSNNNSDYFRVTSLFGDPSLYGRHVVLAIGVLLVAAGAAARGPAPGRRRCWWSCGPGSSSPTRSRAWSR